MRKKICVVTGSRAEYGLLKPLIEKINASEKLTLQLLVTGMHLSPEFGSTYMQIEADGFKIDEKVEILMSSDSPHGICKSMGIGLFSFSDSLTRLGPHIVVLLGDRFEIMSLALASSILNIPIAHIHGGEITEGSYDDGFRHCITKLSLIHFTAVEEYKRRVIQLGEQPDNVYNVGAIGLDNIKEMKLLSRKELEKDLSVSFGSLNFLVTLHPITKERNLTKIHCEELLKALDCFPDSTVFFTYSNADNEGRYINNKILEYTNTNKKRTYIFKSLGQLKYLSLLKQVDAIIGNSSSGIIEAPSLKIPTVNIGNRQKGRIKNKTIVDCNPNKVKIINSIKYVLSNDMKKYLDRVKNIYGDGNSSDRIINILENVNYNRDKKCFYDLDF